MAKTAYIGIAKKAKEIIKAYVGVNGIARKIKKSYIGIDGIARETWKGVTWKKYSCATSYTYHEDPANIGFTTKHYYGTETSTFYSSYSFSESSGYTLSGLVTLDVHDAVGYYTGSSHSAQVFQIVSMSSTKVDFSYEAVVKCVGTANQYTHYSKGTTSYGEVIADRDALPEEGSLIRGSIEGDYCVVRVDNTYYYYEKVT